MTFSFIHKYALFPFSTKELERDRTFDSLSVDTMQGTNFISFIARPLLTGHPLSSLQAVVKLEGDNKMVTTFKGIKSVTELNGDTITNVS